VLHFAVAVRVRSSFALHIVHLLVHQRKDVALARPRRISTLSRARLRTEVVSMPLGVKTGHRIGTEGRRLLVQNTVVFGCCTHVTFRPRTSLVITRTGEFLLLFTHGLAQTRSAKRGWRLVWWIPMLDFLLHVGAKEGTRSTHLSHAFSIRRCGRKNGHRRTSTLALGVLEILNACPANLLTGPMSFKTEPLQVGERLLVLHAYLYHGVAATHLLDR
jgi:hypothetical protein